MSELPAGWTLAEIGNLSTLYNGRGFKKSEWGTVGLPIIRIQNLNNKLAGFNYYNGDVDERHIVKKGTLLFAWSGTPGTSFGAHEWRGETGALNQHIFKIDIDEKNINKKFFKYAINQKLNELISNAQGGVGLRHVTKKTFEGTAVVLPPLNEQTRIANKLDILLGKVEAAQSRLEIIPNLHKRFRQSVLAAVTSGELTKEWRADEKNNNDAIDLLVKLRAARKQVWEREQLTLFEIKNKIPKNEKWKDKYKLIEPIDQTELPEIPYTWKWCGIDELSEVVSDGDHNPPKKSQSGIRHLTIKNVNNGKISFEGCAYVTKEGYARTSERYTAKEGDVLITCIGTIGRTAIVGEDTFFSTDRNLAFVRLFEEVNEKYIQLILNSPLLQSCMRKGSVGNAQFALYLKVIRKLPIPLCTLAEQEEIVRRVESLFTLADTVEKQYQAAKQRLDKLTQSILAKAFRGELVPQSTSDEPAEKLLERIRDQRQTEVASKQKNKIKSVKKKIKAAKSVKGKVLTGESHILSSHAKIRAEITVLDNETAVINKNAEDLFEIIKKQFKNKAFSIGQIQEHVNLNHNDFKDAMFWLIKGYKPNKILPKLILEDGYTLRVITKE